MKQTTIKKEFRLTGMGLHTGRTVTVTVCPAPPDFGIAFRRTDRFNIVTQKALATEVGETVRGTTIGSGRHSIATIEHLMSALHGCQLDNVLVELDGGEVPILDGSARRMPSGIPSLLTNRCTSSMSLQARCMMWSLPTPLRWTAR